MGGRGRDGRLRGHIDERTGTDIMHMTMCIAAQPAIYYPHMLLFLGGILGKAAQCEERRLANARA
eukprot:2555497-Pyramimonas_sp.AAC.1